MSVCRGYLRCAACDALMDRDPLCSDLGVLTLHWMSEHRERWQELRRNTKSRAGHPEG